MARRVDFRSERQMSTRERLKRNKDRRASEEAEAANEEGMEQVRALFNESLKGKLNQVPAKNVASDLEGIESFAILPSPTKDSLNVVFFYINKGGKTATTTLRLSEASGGVLQGRLPNEIKVPLFEINFEVLSAIDALHIESVHQTDEELSQDTIDAIDEAAEGDEDLEETDEVAEAEGVDLPAPHAADVKVFPVEDPGEAGKPQEQGDKKEGPKIRKDERRYEHLFKMPDLLFVVAPKSTGLDGYVIGVFQHTVVLENTQLDNAAYVVALDSPIDVPAEELDKPAGERFSKIQRESIVKEHLKRDLFPDDVISKQTLRRTRNPRRIVHDAQDGWMKRLPKAVGEFNVPKEGVAEAA